MTGVLGAMLVVAGCGPSPSATPTAPQAITGAWRFAAGTVDGAPIVEQPAAPITLVAGADGVGGHGGCNGYALRDVRLGLGRIASHGVVRHLALCHPAAIGVAESLFIEALERAERFAIIGGSLHMAGPGVDLRFERDR